MCITSPFGSLHEPDLVSCPSLQGLSDLLLTVLNRVTLRRLLRKVSGPVSGSIRKLQVALSSLQDLEQSPSSEPVIPVDALAGFDLLTLNVEHTMKTKVVALRHLLQWSGYPTVVLLQEVGALPARFVFHCLYWHTFTVVSSSSAKNLSWQSVEVAVDYGFKWDPGSHMRNEVNDPLQLVVMQPLDHAILYQVTIGRGPSGLAQNAPRGIYSDCKGGHDGADFCVRAVEDRAQVPGPKLVETYRSLYLWGT